MTELEIKQNISFVIPAYNCASTLSQSVDSIFDSNFTDGDEVIIVDDCSTDETRLEIKRLLEKYSPDIKSVNNELNKGCPASRNIGINLTKNDLIFNLDSDNILPSNSILILKNYLIENNGDVASFEKYYYFQNDTSKVTHEWICNAGIFTLADIFAGMVNPAPGGNFLYKKSIWEKVGGYWEYGRGLHEAWGFSFKMLINKAVFLVVPNTFYFHRYSHESLFVRENKKQDASAEVSNKFIENSISIFDDNSAKYIKENKNWFDLLEKHPLKLKDGIFGKNGKILFRSKTRQIIYLIKKFLKI